MILFEDELDRQLDPPINYKFMRKALKSYTCEECDCEIHKNEYYWSYKPNPDYNKITKKKTYHEWSKRCIDHEPRYHSELTIIKNKWRLYYGI